MSLNLKALVYVTIIKCKKKPTKPECAAVLIILQEESNYLFLQVTRSTLNGGMGIPIS